MRKFLSLLLILFIGVGTCYADSFERMLNKAYDPDTQSLRISAFETFDGITFYKNYETASSLDADISIGSPTATFTRATDATHPATYIDSNGVIQLVTTADQPRFTQGYYDSTGFHSAKGLMVEAAGTNLFVNGAFDANSTWNDGVTTDSLKYGATARWELYAGGGGAVTENTISTDSKYSRSAQIKITNDGGAGADIQLYNSNNLSLANATTYTVSFWIKTDSSVTLPYLINEADDDFTLYNDLGTFVTVANTWIRITKSFQGLAGGGDVTDAQFKIYLGNVGNITVNIEGLQIEASTYPTSFIPTTTAALTRNPSIDSGVNSGNSTAAEETIIMKVMPEWSATALTASTYLYDTDTKSRAVYVGTDDFVHFQPNATDTAGATVSSTTKLAVNTSYVIAVVCKSTGNPNQEIYINGVSEASDNTDFTAPAWGTNFYVGCKADGTSQGNLIYQKIVKFNRALTATEVASVTDLLEG